MPKNIDYYFSLISPWAYLGNARLIEIAAKNKAAINFKPINVLDVFSQSGGLPLGKRAPQRQAYRLVELERWKKRLNVRLNNHPKFFPADEKLAAAMVIAAQENGFAIAPFVQTIMAAVWADDKDISDFATLVSLANQTGLDGEALIVDAKSEPVKALWDGYTAEAIERQVFGVPTYIVDNVLFWGQDRLDFLEETLRSSGQL